MKKILLALMTVLALSMPVHADPYQLTFISSPQVENLAFETMRGRFNGVTKYEMYARYRSQGFANAMYVRCRNGSLL